MPEESASKPAKIRHNHARWNSRPFEGVSQDWRLLRPKAWLLTGKECKLNGLSARRCVIALILLAALLPGCAKETITRKVEKRIEAALPQYIGPAASYDARVDAGLGEMMNGRLRALHIVGTGVQLTPEITVDRLLVDMQGVVFDPNKNALKSVESTRFTAEIRETALQAYLRRTHPKIEGITVSIGRNELQASARPGVLGISVPVEATGKLALANALKLNFEPTRIRAVGIPAPSMISELLMRFVNPVLDFSRFSYPARLSDVRMEPGKLIATGTAEFRAADQRSDR